MRINSLKTKKLKSSQANNAFRLKRRSKIYRLTTKIKIGSCGQSKSFKHVSHIPRYSTQLVEIKYYHNHLKSDYLCLIKSF